MSRIFESVLSRLLSESRRKRFLAEADENCKQEGYWGAGGAGMLFVCTEDKTMLLLLRASWVDQPGVWGNPGGAIGEEWTKTPVPPEDRIKNENEYKASAMRETVEECGSLPPGFSIGQIKTTVSYEDCGWLYKTYICDISLEQKEAWTPKLQSPDNETDEFRWFSIDELPSPSEMHFGVKFMLSRALSLF